MGIKRVNLLTLTPGTAAPVPGLNAANIIYDINSNKLSAVVRTDEGTSFKDITSESENTGSSYFSGGTVDGATNFTSSLSATTFFSGSTSFDSILGNLVSSAEPVSRGTLNYAATTFDWGTNEFQYGSISADTTITSFENYALGSRLLEVSGSTLNFSAPNFTTKGAFATGLVNYISISCINTANTGTFLISYFNNSEYFSNIKEVTLTSYTLSITDKALIDSGRELIINYNNSSAGLFIVPTNATVGFSVGSQLTLKQRAAGQLQVSGITGVLIESIRNTSSEIKISQQYGAITLTKEATDRWSCVGALKTT